MRHGMPRLTQVSEFEIIHVDRTSDRPHGRGQAVESPR